MRWRARSIPNAREVTPDGEPSLPPPVTLAELGQGGAELAWAGSGAPGSVGPIPPNRAHAAMVARSDADHPGDRTDSEPAGEDRAKSTKSSPEIPGLAQPSSED